MRYAIAVEKKLSQAIWMSVPSDRNPKSMHWQLMIWTENYLNELAAEDVLQEQFSELSLNALSSQDTLNCIKLKAKVKDKVLLILINSGSTHSFIS